MYLSTNQAHSVARAKLNLDEILRNGLQTNVYAEKTLSPVNWKKVNFLTHFFKLFKYLSGKCSTWFFSGCQSQFRFSTISGISNCKEYIYCKNV